MGRVDWRFCLLLTLPPYEQFVCEHMCVSTYPLHTRTHLHTLGVVLRSVPEQRVPSDLHLLLVEECKHGIGNRVIDRDPAALIGRIPLHLVPKYHPIEPRQDPLKGDRQQRFEGRSNGAGKRSGEGMRGEKREEEGTTRGYREEKICHPRPPLSSRHRMRCCESCCCCGC